MIRSDRPASQTLLECFENRFASRVLTDTKFGNHLPAEMRCLCGNDAHIETAFAVSRPSKVVVADVRAHANLSGWSSALVAFSLRRVAPDTHQISQHTAEFNDSSTTWSTVSRRSEPSSRNALIGEQPNPWDVLPPQDASSRHRGAKPCRRCELLGKISLLSPG